MAAIASDRFETVAWVYSPSDLALLMSRFIEADVFVQRVSVWHAAIDPGLTTALGGVELRVRAEDATRAHALLGELEPVPHRIRMGAGLLLLFLVMAFFGVGPPPRQIPTLLTGDAAVRPEP